jgi:PKD repeat protein/serine/threonine protein phosphatase PrpC
MELAAFSDRGIGTRERLEDYAADRIITTAGGLQLQIAMVCDGAGGGEAGELAARLTSRTVFEYLEISPETSVPKLLIQAVEQANKTVYNELHGTGTSTVSMAAVHLNDGSDYGRLYIANVGNSRVYLMRGGRIVRLNIDHTLANEYVFAGQMSFEEAKQLDDPEYVTRAIGIGAQVSVDIGFYAERGKNFVNSRRAFRIGQRGMELQEGDTVFAASDGLFPYVQDEEFLQYALDDDVERATRTLLKYAADRGPDDNIALSVLFVPSNARRMVTTGPRLSRNQRAGIGIFLLAVILLIGFLALQVASGENQRVAILTTQTFVQQIIVQSSYTHTPTPLPDTPTPTQQIIVGQVGNRFSLTQSGLPVFTGRYIDPLQPDEINYLSIAGQNALILGTINQANLYLQPGTSIRLNQVNDSAGSERIDLLLGRGGNLFVNAGDFDHGGVSVALEQNPDIVIQSQSACLSVKQISADATKQDDTDKVALICYGGGSCTYQLPGGPPASVAGNQQAVLDVDNKTLISTNPISQQDIDTYRDTIWQLTHREDQLNCISNWLDEDKDNINYPADQCPSDFGPAFNNGCPEQRDLDGDNLVGVNDRCPLDAGPASNQGCPTTGPVATQFVLTETAAAQTTDTPTPTATPTATEIPIPEANDDSYSTLGDTALRIAAPGVLANDVLNEATLTPFSGDTTKGGTVALKDDGSFEYTPKTDFVGLDTFDYTLTNDSGEATGHVTIDVMKPPPKPPVAAFSVFPSSGNTPLVVSITNTSSGPINTYDWDFGDGSTHSVSSSPSAHTYKNTGSSSQVFTITLTVTGPGGTDSVTHSVTVSVSPPVACFSPTNSSITVGNSIAFVNCSTGSISSYSWSFGETGSISNLANPSYTYNNVSTGSGFVVTLTVTGPGGTSTATGTVTVVPPPPIACFTPIDNLTFNATSNPIQFDAGCTGNKTGANFAWSFSDGGGANGQITSHVYNTAGTYTVTLTVTVPGAGTSQLTHTYHVNNATVACFNAPLTVSSGAGAAFTDCTGPQPLPGGLTYSWTFGDGGTSAATSPNHTYNVATTTSFNVVLNIMNGATTISSVNHAISVIPLPVAGDDLTYTVGMGQTLTVNAAAGLLANDTPLGSISITAPLTPYPARNGTLNKKDGSFTYTPDVGFAGAVNFNYTITSTAGATDTGAVRICVNPIVVNDTYNKPPPAGTLTVNIPIAALEANDTVPAAPPGFSLPNAATTGGGAVAIVAGNVRYTAPNAAYLGPDTFTYRLTIGACTVDGTVTVTINGGNVAPVANADSYATGAGALLTVNAANGVLANDTDANLGDTLTAVLDTTTANGVLALNAATGAFTYQPAVGPPAFTGPDTFTYHVNDGTANSTPVTVTITVGGNVPPIATNDSYITPVSTALVEPAGTGILSNDFDPDTGNNTGLTITVGAVPTNGTLTLIDTATGAFTYTPNPGFFGSDSFTYTLTDAVGAVSNLATVTISVGSLTANGDTYNTAFNTTLNVPPAQGMLANDIPNTGVTAQVQFGPFYGTLNAFDPTTGAFTYTPPLNFSGQDYIYYETVNGTFTSNLAWAIINVGVAGPTGLNDGYNVPVDTQLNVPGPGVLINDTDPGGNPLSSFLLTLPTNGTLNTFNFDGSFSYTPNAGYNGPDSFTYEAWNGFAVSNSTTVTIQVGAGNAAPIANPDPSTPTDPAYITAVGKPLIVTAPGVLANDTDADLDPLSVIPQAGAATAQGGLVTLNADGSFTYTPPAAPANFKGIDTFTYQAIDGKGGVSTPATVTITVGVKPRRPVVIQLPAPPPATRCTDTNFENPGEIRSHFTNDIDRDQLFCRLIAANGSYMYWFGSPITNAGNVGAQNVLDLGLVAAVDVFSMRGATGFVGDVDICLKGSGYMIYMNVNGAPRVPQLWSAWTTDAFPGYTCTTLYAPGTVILVANKPK